MTFDMMISTYIFGILILVLGLITSFYDHSNSDLDRSQGLILYGYSLMLIVLLATRLS